MAQATNCGGGHCDSPTPSWSPMAFASQASLLSSPARTLQGEFSGFSRDLLRVLLTGLPAPVPPLLPIWQRAARVLSPNHKYGSAAPCLNPAMAPHYPRRLFLAWLLLLQHHMGTFPSGTLPVGLLSLQQLPHTSLTPSPLLFPVPAVLSPPSSR